MFMKKFLILFYFILFATLVKSQNIGFTWQVSGCCVKVVVSQDYIDFCPFWQLNLGGNIFDESTNPDGIINHCFPVNGNYITILSGCSPSYGELIKIKECNSGEQNNCFESVTVDECCVKVVVCNSPPPRKWKIDFGDNTIVTSDQNNGSNEVTHCYKSTGNFDISLFYDNGGGASKIVSIVECKPIQNCILSNLCWEDFMNTMDCASSVRLKLPNGNIIDIPFTPINNATNHCNDPYFQNPIPASIPVVGGYCEIVAQIMKAIENQGFSVDYTPGDPLNRPAFACNKGNVDIVGFFFQSEVEVLGIGGDDCNGGTAKFRKFEDSVPCN